MGQAIAPLRDEGVLFFGSGLSYHSMPGFSRNGAASHASAASKVTPSYDCDIRLLPVAVHDNDVAMVSISPLNKDAELLADSSSLHGAKKGVLQRAEDE